MSDFIQISPEKIKKNPFSALGKEWALLTAGDSDSYNTMTVAWGMFGVMWNKNICIAVVRPQRYTYNFMESSDTFSLTFFPEKYKEQLQFCGTNSGKDVDKIKICNFTPVFTDNGIYFQESNLVLLLKKNYFDDFKPDHFLDPSIHDCYPTKDYHRLYIGEVVDVLEKK